jgi:hypothetical protein
MFDPEASIGMETEIYFSTKHKDYLVWCMNWKD